MRVHQPPLSIDTLPQAEYQQFRTLGTFTEQQHQPPMPDETSVSSAPFCSRDNSKLYSGQKRSEEKGNSHREPKRLVETNQSEETEWREDPADISEVEQKTARKKQVAIISRAVAYFYASNSTEIENSHSLLVAVVPTSIDKLYSSILALVDVSIIRRWRYYL